MTMTLGQLRHRVTLRAPVGDGVRVGASQVTYRDVATVPAAVQAFREYEVARFRQQERKAERAIVIRRRTDIGSAWRVVHAGVEYQVESVGAADDGEQWTTLQVFKAGR